VDRSKNGLGKSKVSEEVLALKYRSRCPQVAIYRSYRGTQVLGRERIHFNAAIGEDGVLKKRRKRLYGPQNWLGKGAEKVSGTGHMKGSKGNRHRGLKRVKRHRATRVGKGTMRMEKRRRGIRGKKKVNGIASARPVPGPHKLSRGHREKDRASMKGKIPLRIGSNNTTEGKRYYRKA